MANDPSLALRQAIVTLLRTTAGLTDITTAAKVFGEQPDPTPERPFIRYGVDEVVPRRPQCWDGAVIDFPVHSFSEAKYTDQVRAMNRAVAETLDGAVIDLEDGMKANIVWLVSTVNRDAGDPKGWHGITRFRATI